MKKRITALALACVMVMGTVAAAAGVEKTITVTPMEMSVNGCKVTPTDAKGAEAEVFAYNGTTYAPVRYLCELLGIDVAWDRDDPGTVKLVNVPNAPAGDVKPGTYYGQAQGFGGPVNAEVTVDASGIVDVKLTGPEETPAIGGAALEALAASAKEKGADLDGVSGATYTSNAAREAVKAALMGAASPDGTVADGKYTVNAVGHEGTIVVTTMFQGGKIKSVTINSQSETEGVGTYAIDRMPGRIVEAQSVNVDAVGGATVTSTAIKDRKSVV